MPWEADDSESNFNLARGTRPHAWGSTSLPPTLLFPFLSRLWIRNTPPTTESDHSALVRPDKIKPTSTKGVRDRSTCWSNQVLKLTDYHISRYVASTFKRLTKWATHRELSQILTTPAGYHNYTTPPIVLIFQQEFKVNQFLYARERQETTRLLPFLVSRATSR